MEAFRNEKLSRFEFDINGHLAIIDYRLNDNVYSIPRVYIPKSLEGNGYGSKILSIVVDIIESEGAKIIPICPFVQIYMERHPEKKFLLA